MIRNITCIVCPNSCSLKVSIDGDNITVEGNRCNRGMQFALTEIKNPVRTVTSTVATTFKKHVVLPCRTTKEVPKEKVFEVIEQINKVLVDKPLKRGDIIIENILGLDSDIIATTDLLEEERY